MKICPTCNQILPLSDEEVKLINEALNAGIGITELAKEFDKNRNVIYRIKRRIEKKVSD